MYPTGNPLSNTSGERHSSYQHYSMAQVNNDKPIINREHEEQTQSWGQPPSSVYPSTIDSDKNYTFNNRLGSSSSSLFDRNNAVLNDNIAANNNSSYQQQSLTSQYHLGGQSVSPTANALRQQQQQQQQQSNASSTYARVSNTTNQQHFHDVPYFHGFKFQAIPGFFSIERKAFI
jgi:hypothetical protein